MRIWAALVVLALALSGCGADSDAGPATTGTSRTTTTTSSSTSTTLPATTSSTSSTTIAVVLLIEVTTGDGTWAFPREVCAGDDGRGDAVRDALTDADAALRSAVNRRVSGWPTTTIPLDPAPFEADARDAAVRALVLAGVLGATDELLASWDEFEQGYADEALQYPPVQEIRVRLAEWRGVANRVSTALSGVCSEG